MNISELDSSDINILIDVMVKAQKLKDEGSSRKITLDTQAKDVFEKLNKVKSDKSNTTELRRRIFSSLTIDEEKTEPINNFLDEVLGKGNDSGINDLKTKLQDYVHFTFKQEKPSILEGVLSTRIWNFIFPKSTPPQMNSKGGRRKSRKQRKSRKHRSSVRTRRQN